MNLSQVIRLMYKTFRLKFEPQMLGWLIDLYRSKLEYEEFRHELGFFWGDLASIHYSRLSDALQYYTAVLILAQQQALLKINPNLMLNIYQDYLLPMQVIFF